MYVRASSLASSSKVYEGAVHGSFLLSPPLRLPFGLRHTANLHAVMTSCRKTANNKSERPSYTRRYMCVDTVRRCCNERHSHRPGCTIRNNTTQLLRCTSPCDLPREVEDTRNHLIPLQNDVIETYILFLLFINKKYMDHRNKHFVVVVLQLMLKYLRI